MEKPTVFIGSSTEGLEIARAVEWHLTKDAEVTLWSHGVFGLGDGTLEALVSSLDQFDFGVLILTPDDLIESQGQRYNSPRDNVLIELGLFLGNKGRKRTFVLCEVDAELKIPSDLAGVKLAKFSKTRTDNNMRAAVSPVCTELIEQITLLGRAPVNVGRASLQDKRDGDPRNRSLSLQLPSDSTFFHIRAQFISGLPKVEYPEPVFLYNRNRDYFQSIANKLYNGRPILVGNISIEAFSLNHGFAAMNILATSNRIDVRQIVEYDQSHQDKFWQVLSNEEDVKDVTYLLEIYDAYSI
ncbi:MAG: nucleotide-binding protein [Nitrospirae bacterium]|nr:nucleotide-binding protein [Nitrospirota bacterium]